VRLARRSDRKLDAICSAFGATSFRKALKNDVELMDP